MQQSEGQSRSLESAGAESAGADRAPHERVGQEWYEPECRGRERAEPGPRASGGAGSDRFGPDGFGPDGIGRARAGSDIARDISYANGAGSRAARVLIRLIENATGRRRLIRRARGYETEVAAGADFWQVICARYGLTLDIAAGSLAAIPATGPLVLVANHPYGILDGLMMGQILSRVRGGRTGGETGGGFRILAHHIFRRAPDLERVILPVSFDETPEGLATNLETRAEALRHLAAGGAIGIFPGGTVSTGARMFDPPMDPGWRSFTARMIAKSGATVVPVFFEGQNSRLFQIASHLHATLRVGMLIREFRSRLNRPVRVVIGAPILPEAIEPYRKDARALMDFLRKSTYELSPVPLDPARLGHEFEEKHRGRHRGGSGVSPGRQARAGNGADGSGDFR